MKQEEYLETLSDNNKYLIEVLKKMFPLTIGGFDIADWSDDEIEDYLPTLALIARDVAVTINKEKYEAMAYRVVMNIYNRGVVDHLQSEDRSYPAITSYLAYYVTPLEGIVIALMTLDKDVVYISMSPPQIP